MKLAFVLFGVLLIASVAGEAIPVDPPTTHTPCPANITLTLREGEVIRGPTVTTTPPDYPLEFKIQDGMALRGPIIISVCGTDARVEVSKP